MNVWLTIPSAKNAAAAQQCVDAWRRMGYRVALWRDQDDAVDADFRLVGRYPGYASACNALIREVLARDPDAAWCICAGDDIWPDPTKRADEIGQECIDYFEEPRNGSWVEGTFGVMQPTGDRWGEDYSYPEGHPLRGAYIDRVAGSAWYGREYCERMYGGVGPLCESYTHMFVDQEARDVAVSLGVYWERCDLTQMHVHWQRTGSAMPGYLAIPNSQHHWVQSEMLYRNRRAAGFPGHQPILECVQL